MFCIHAKTGFGLCEKLEVELSKVAALNTGVRIFISRTFSTHSLLTLTFVWQVNICTLHKVSKMFIFVSWYQFSQLITAISYVAIVFINECSSFYKQTQCFFPEVSWEVLRSSLHRLVQRNLLLLCSCSKLYGCEPGQSESKWKAARLRLVAGAAHPFIWLECFSDLIVKLVSPHTCVVWVS